MSHINVFYIVLDDVDEKVKNTCSLTGETDHGDSPPDAPAPPDQAEQDEGKLTDPDKEVGDTAA